MPIRIVIADDHPIVRQGLRSLFAQHDDLLVVAEVADGRELLATVATQRPDVIVLDLRMPHVAGVEALRRLGLQSGAIPTVVLTSYHEPDYVLTAIKAGASGYLLKSSDYGMIVDAVRAAAAGEQLISPGLVGTLFQVVRAQGSSRIQEESGLDTEAQQILALMAEGATNAEIATQLHWSEVTVKRRVQDILDTLQVRNRIQAVTKAIRQGWI